MTRSACQLGLTRAARHGTFAAHATFAAQRGDEPLTYFWGITPKPNASTRSAIGAATTTTPELSKLAGWEFRGMNHPRWALPILCENGRGQACEQRQRNNGCQDVH